MAKISSLIRTLLTNFYIQVPVFIGVFLVIAWFGHTNFQPKDNPDIGGWLQTSLALLAVPIIIVQLHEISQSFNKKPEISLGLVSVKHLPFSEVRKMSALPLTVEVTSGYAHFFLIVRNSGSAPAKHIKIYIEHINRDINSADLFYAPLVKISEFSDDKQKFWSENNFDFVFRAGSDWIINTNDIEPFGFHLTTSISEGEKYIDKNGHERALMAPPEPSVVDLVCTVWADDLDEPVCKPLRVNVT